MLGTWVVVVRLHSPNVAYIEAPEFSAPAACSVKLTQRLQSVVEKADGFLVVNSRRICEDGPADLVFVHVVGRVLVPWMLRAILYYIIPSVEYVSDGYIGYN